MRFLFSLAGRGHVFYRTAGARPVLSPPSTYKAHRRFLFLRPFLDILQKQKLEGDTSQKTRKYGVKSGFDAVSAFEAAKVGSNFCRPAKAEQTLGIVLSFC